MSERMTNEQIVEAIVWFEDYAKHTARHDTVCFNEVLRMQPLVLQALNQLRTDLAEANAIIERLQKVLIEIGDRALHACRMSEYKDEVMLLEDMNTIAHRASQAINPAAREAALAAMTERAEKAEEQFSNISSICDDYEGSIGERVLRLREDRDWYERWYEDACDQIKSLEYKYDTDLAATREKLRVAEEVIQQRDNLLDMAVREITCTDSYCGVSKRRADHREHTGELCSACVVSSQINQVLMGEEIGTVPKPPIAQIKEVTNE